MISAASVICIPAVRLAFSPPEPWLINTVGNGPCPAGFQRKPFRCNRPLGNSTTAGITGREDCDAAEIVSARTSANTFLTSALYPTATTTFQMIVANGRYGSLSVSEY